MCLEFGCGLLLAAVAGCGRGVSDIFQSCCHRRALTGHMQSLVLCLPCTEVLWIAAKSLSNSQHAPQLGIPARIVPAGVLIAWRHVA